MKRYDQNLHKSTLQQRKKVVEKNSSQSKSAYNTNAKKQINNLSNDFAKQGQGNKQNRQ